MPRPTDRARLAGFIAKYSPPVAKVARAVLPKLRKAFRGTHELVYDNYNALAIGWSPSGRTSDVICSIALYPRWVTLFFLRGKGLPDPDRRLRGSGSRVRSIVLEHGVKTLDETAVKRLIAAAIASAPIATAPVARRAAPETIIMSVSPNRRPRRPAVP